MFLDKVQTLSRIGDFLVGSSQNLIASGVWATVKLTLGIAVGSLSFFKRISELFLKVGRASSITRDLVEVFPNSKELQDLMCEYLIVLVCFCKDVVRVLNKPTILQLSSPFIAFFDKEASKFETELTQLSTAIDRKATVFVSQGQVESANTISKMSRTLSQWSTKSEAKKQQDLARRSSRVQDKLSSPIDQKNALRPGADTARKEMFDGCSKSKATKIGYQQMCPSAPGLESCTFTGSLEAGKAYFSRTLWPSSMRFGLRLSRHRLSSGGIKSPISSATTIMPIQSRPRYY